MFSTVLNKIFFPRQMYRGPLEEDKMKTIRQVELNISNQDLQEFLKFIYSTIKTMTGHFFLIIILLNMYIKVVVIILVKYLLINLF